MTSFSLSSRLDDIVDELLYLCNAAAVICAASILCYWLEGSRGWKYAGVAHDVASTGWRRHAADAAGSKSEGNFKMFPFCS